jgi:hypothetical protein
MLNASAEDISSADKPKAAASTCTSVAVWIPMHETSPTSRPCSTARPTM